VRYIHKSNEGVGCLVDIAHLPQFGVEWGVGWEVLLFVRSLWVSVDKLNSLVADINLGDVGRGSLMAAVDGAVPNLEQPLNHQVTDSRGGQLGLPGAVLSVEVASIICRSEEM